MAKRHFNLNETETRELQEAYATCKNGPARTRLQAVRLYGSGYQTQEIEAITGVERRVLLRWCAKYRRHGLTALYDQRKGGNHRALTDEQVADVRAKLQQYRPVDVLGEEQVATADGLHWTVADLKPALARWQGVTYQSDTSYRTLLKRCGFSYQRAGKQFRSRSEVKLAEFGEQLEKKTDRHRPNGAANGHPGRGRSLALPAGHDDGGLGAVWTNADGALRPSSS